MGKKRVAVLISGRGSNMTALIEAARAEDYPAEIVLVVSNRPEAAGLARAREAGVATAIVDHRPFGEDREAFERALDAELRAQRIDFVCLAGFMRLLTPWFVDPLERPDAQHSSGAVAAIQRAWIRIAARSRPA